MCASEGRGGGLCRVLMLAVGLLAWPALVAGQELVPNAYAISPVGVNVVTVASAISKGDLAFDPSAPITDASATIDTIALGYGRTLSVAGRSAQIAVIVPYLLGDLQGLYVGQFQEVTRSGLGDTSVRFGVNLFGAPSMTLKEFAAYRPRTNIGASLTVQVPSGQYYPGKLINIGNNRWTLKPEVAFTRVRGRWTYEVYTGLTVFTDNTNFVNGGLKEQAPIVSAQFHLLYTVRPRLWLGVDANFWTGGRVTVNSVDNVEMQRNSRVGATLSLPIIDRRQSLRFAYSRGAYTRIGGDFHSLGISYAYAWGAGL